jgi:hypothetical protein
MTREMRRGEIAFLLTILVVVSALGLAGILGPHATQTSLQQAADCGYLFNCAVKSPSGLVVRVWMNTTSVKPNGSLTIQIDGFNPTTHALNLSPSDQWFLRNMTQVFPCYRPRMGVPIFGFEIFRGYYTSQNVTSATNVYALPWTSCPAGWMSVVAVDFLVSPSSNQTQVQWKDGQNSTLWGVSQQVYANDGLIACDTNSHCAVASFGSDQPGVYTIAAGDEWGALLLLHFSVVNGSS